MKLKELLKIKSELRMPILSSVVLEYLKSNNLLYMKVSEDMCPDASIKSYIPDIQEYLRQEAGEALESKEIILIWLTACLIELENKK